MSTQIKKGPRHLLVGFISAIARNDCFELERIAHPEIEICVPGSADVHITHEGNGRAELCEWVRRVHDNCGQVEIEAGRFFEHPRDVRAVGKIRIARPAGLFGSPCSIYASVNDGQLVTFELLLDTHALANFRATTH